jgi:hypothetical protein
MGVKEKLTDRLMPEGKRLRPVLNAAAMDISGNVIMVYFNTE